jgi:hypothetical protein
MDIRWSGARSGRVLMRFSVSSEAGSERRRTAKVSNNCSETSSAKKRRGTGACD